MTKHLGDLAPCAARQQPKAVGLKPEEDQVVLGQQTSDVVPERVETGRISRLSIALCTAASDNPVRAAACAGVYPHMILLYAIRRRIML